VDSLEGPRSRVAPGTASHVRLLADGPSISGWKQTSYRRLPGGCHRCLATLTRTAQAKHVLRVLCKICHPSCPLLSHFEFRQRISAGTYASSLHLRLSLPRKTQTQRHSIETPGGNYIGGRRGHFSYHINAHPYKIYIKKTKLN